MRLDDDCSRRGGNPLYRPVPGIAGREDAVRAYPYEFDGRDDLSIEFEVGGEICFRIVEEIGAPSPRLTG